MSAPILILPPRYTQDSIALWRAAGRAHWPVVRLQNWRVPEDLKGRDVCIYGEPLFAAVVAEALKLELLEPPADWLIGLPPTLLQRSVQYTTFEHANAANFPAFVKPAGEKSFEARVYARAGELPSTELVPPETPILISEPVEWVVEYRCFVLDGEVRTASPYWRNGETTQAEDGSWPMDETELAAAVDFAGQVLRKFPLPVGVLDVGIIRDRGWAVVEANPAYGAGIYGCDADEVLQVIWKSCRRADKT